MEMMLEVAMRVMDTEGDKVADMVLKIPDDDFTDVTGLYFLFFANTDCGVSCVYTVFVFKYEIYASCG